MQGDKARGASETIRVEVSAERRTFAREKGQLAGIGQQETVLLPKRGAPTQTLIEFVFGQEVKEFRGQLNGDPISLTPFLFSAPERALSLRHPH